MASVGTCTSLAVVDDALYEIDRRPGMRVEATQP